MRAPRRAASRGGYPSVCSPRPARSPHRPPWPRRPEARSISTWRNADRLLWRVTCLVVFPSLRSRIISAAELLAIPARAALWSAGGAAGQNFMPSSTAMSQSAAESLARMSGFSPEVQQKCAHWHQRSADLIAMLDSLIDRKVETVDAQTASAERHTAEARAILAALRAALAELRDGEDPLGEAVARVNARLPPLAPAAADAIAGLSDAEISAIRSLRQAPPASVRLVVTSVCTLLRLRVPPLAGAATPLQSSSDASAQSGVTSSAATGAAPSLSNDTSRGISRGTRHTPIVSWEASQQMLARADFTKALRGFDPRTLHAHPELAASVRQRLADLAHAPAARGSVGAGRGRPWRAAPSSHAGWLARASSLSSVGQTALMLRAAVRGGGQAARYPIEPSPYPQSPTLTPTPTPTPTPRALYPYPYPYPYPYRPYPYPYPYRRWASSSSGVRAC